MEIYLFKEKIASDKKSGFTLLELLIAIAILGILSVFLIGNFQTSQKRARDAVRKSDLFQIQQAMEMYNTDKGKYPDSSSGQIVGCGTCGSSPVACDWDDQEEFKDTNGANCGSSYMKQLPKDPLATSYYYYWVSPDNKSYRLYACLEKATSVITPAVTVDCGGCAESCNYYGVASTNEKP